MTIYLASDHAGFELKNILAAFLKDAGHDVHDCGAATYDPEDDFNDYVRLSAQRVAKEPEAYGIILGGSGQGEAMQANRYHGVRAALYYGGPEEILTLSREHNDANVLSLAARFLSAEEAKRAVTRWLDTPFSGVAKYGRRNDTLDSTE